MRIPASPRWRRTTSSARPAAMEPSPERTDQDLRRQSPRPAEDHGLGESALGLCRGLGDGEHARGDLRRHAAQGDLCHHRPAHAGLRFFGGWDFEPEDADNRTPGRHRLHQGRADGRRSSRRAGRQGADLPGRRAQGPDRRQPRSLSRSSRAGSTARANCTRRSTTWPGPAIASRARTARCRRSAARSMSPTPPGPTRSARRN